MSDPLVLLDPISDVENASIKLLRDASDPDGPLGYGFRTLETYPDEWDAYLKDKGQIACPAAWCVFLGADQGDDAGDASGATFVGRFGLVVAAQNLRDETATRQGGPDATQEPGAYRLTVDAVRLISQSMLGLDLVSPVAVKATRLVARTDEMRRQGMALMMIEFTCGIAFGAFTEEPGDFRKFHADWDIPPIGNVAPPLPAADPDASDMVEIPE